MEIKQDVRELADTLKPAIEAAIKEGKTAVSAEEYTKVLEANGLTLDNAKALQTVNTKFFAASTLATGEAYIPEMKKNKDLERGTMEFPMIGKDAFTVVFDRTRENSFTNPATKERETVIKHGATTIGLEIYGAKSKGSMAAVRQHLNDMAKEALAAAMK